MTLLAGTRPCDSTRPREGCGGLKLTISFTKLMLRSREKCTHLGGQRVKIFELNVATSDLQPSLCIVSLVCVRLGSVGIQEDDPRSMRYTRVVVALLAAVVDVDVSQAAASIV